MMLLTRKPGRYSKGDDGHWDQICSHEEARHGEVPETFKMLNQGTLMELEGEVTGKATAEVWVCTMGGQSHLSGLLLAEKEPVRSASGEVQQAAGVRFTS